jgi:hypothetical protein
LKPAARAWLVASGFRIEMVLLRLMNPEHQSSDALSYFFQLFGTLMLFVTAKEKAISRVYFVLKP